MKGAQIAIVDADEARFQRQSAAQFFFVMHFDKHIHVQIMRSFVERARILIRQSGHDDENAIGTPGACLIDLIGIVHEILAQRRQACGLARRAQKFGPALKGRFIGEHGKTGRAARFIGACQKRRTEIGADEAF